MNQTSVQATYRSSSLHSSVIPGFDSCEFWYCSLNYNFFNQAELARNLVNFN